jgi:tRNA(Ile)-lysidine synthase
LKSWLELDHFVFSEMKKHNISKRDFVVCVSGGADSMALASIFGRLVRPHSLKLFHFHHGDFANREFRDQAMVLVQNLAQTLGVELKIVKASRPLRSEREFREARLLALKEFLQTMRKTQGHSESGDEVLVWGHHAQDLLETRLIRLIRGAGPEGLMGMSVWKRPHFRPLLSRSRAEIREYLQLCKIDFLEDPSNQDTRFLRNWLRHDWLPRLETKRKGSLSSLSDSLETIVKAVGSQKPEADLGYRRQAKEMYLDRCVFLTLSEFDQNRALALLLYENGCRDFRQSHLMEIKKHLDNGRKEHRIKVAGLFVVVNAGRILVESKPVF